MLLEDDWTARDIGNALIARGAHVAVAETTAGGLIAARLLSVAGASAWFERGVVCYSREAKAQLTGVSFDLLRTHGAVSREAVLAMAEGLRVVAGVEYAVAESGIAGPSDGRKSPKPVGSAVIAVASPGPTRVEEHLFEGTRVEVMEAIAQRALGILLQVLAAAPGIGTAEPSAN